MREQLRIFLSSPADVEAERLRAVHVITKLNAEFDERIELSPVRWEESYYTAAASFQDQIERPSGCDLVVCVLWKRLGTELPEKYCRADGTTRTGTEFEFEEAYESALAQQVPDILVYRKTAPVMFDAEHLDAEQAQYRSLNQFWQRWFESEEGHFTAGFHNFATTDAFEAQFEAHLRKWLANRSADAVWPIETRGSPFRGLEAFEETHREIFFGRRRAVEQVRARLIASAIRGCPFLLVLGMSGVGKSSLVGAGVVPRLMDPGAVPGVDRFRRLVVRPSTGGLRGLIEAFYRPDVLPELDDGDYEEADQLLRAAERDPESLGAAVGGALRRWSHRLAEEEGYERSLRTRLLLVIDQFEEVFGLAPDEHDGYIAALSALVYSGQCWVLATMRSDFYPVLQSFPDILQLKEAGGQYDLVPPSAAELRDIIRGPARAAGLEFETDERSGENLADILEAAAVETEALPLLEFALEELFEHRDRAQQWLTVAAYEAMEGLDGAIGRRADDVLAKLRARGRVAAADALPELLRILVRVGEEGVATAREVRRDEAAQKPVRAELMEALIEARLLVTRGDESTTYVRIAHEALLKSWAAFRELLAEEREFLRTRTRVGEAAERWLKRNREADLLLPPGRQLAEAEETLARRDELPEFIVAYIEASRSAHMARLAAVEASNQRRLKRARIAALGFAVIGLVATVAGYFAVERGREAERQQASAEKSAIQADAARVEAERQERLALESATEAEHARREAEAERALAEKAREVADAERQTAEAARQRALVGESLLLANQSLQETEAGRWRYGIQLAFEALPENLAAPERPLVPQALAALYQAIDQDRRLMVLAEHSGPLLFAAFSPNGKRIVTGSNDKTAALWDAETGALIRRLPDHTDIVTDAAFSPDSSRIVTGGGTRAQVWDAVSGLPLLTLSQHDRSIFQVAFTPDGTRIVTSAADDTVRIWDALSGEQLVVLREENAERVLEESSTALLQINRSMELFQYRMWGAMHDFAVSPDGRWVATRGTHDHWGVARIWDLETGRLHKRLAAAPRKSVNPFQYAISFSPDGGLLAAAGLDHVVRLWDTASWREVAALTEHEDAVNAVIFNLDGKLLVTASDDKTVRIWDLSVVETPELLVTLREHRDRIHAAALSPDGQFLATASEDETALLWNITNPEAPYLIATLRDHGSRVNHVAFSPDSRKLITTSHDATARVWRIDTAVPTAVLRATPPAKFGISSSAWSGILSVDPSGYWPTWQKDITKVNHLLDPTGARVVRGLTGRGVFSMDGARLLAGSELVALPSGAVLTVLPGLGFHMDRTGRRIVGVASEGVSLYDAVTGESIARLSAHQGPLRRVTFSRDASRMATFGEEGLWVWSGETGELFTAVKGFDGALVDVAIAANADRLFGLSDTGHGWMWDLESGRMIASLHKKDTGLRGLAVGPDESTFVLIFIDESAEIRDSEQGGLLAAVPANTINSFLSFISTPQWGPFVEAAPLEQGLALRAAGAPGWRTPIGDGPFLPVIGDLVTRDGRIWSGEDRRFLAQSLSGSPGYESPGFRLTPSGDRLLIWRSEKAELRDTRDGSTLVVVEGSSDAIEDVTLSPDGAMAVIYGKEQSRRVLRLSDGALLAQTAASLNQRAERIVARGALGPRPLELRVSLDGRHARVSDALSGETVSLLKDPDQNITDANFSLSGAELVTIAGDGTVRSWLVDTGQSRFVLGGPNAGDVTAVYAGSDRRIVTRRGDKTVQVWDAADGGEIWSLRLRSGKLEQLFVSADGARIALVTSDERVELWDVRAGRVLWQGAGDRIYQAVRKSSWRSDFGPEDSLQVQALNRTMVVQRDATLILVDSVDGRATEIAAPESDASGDTSFIIPSIWELGDGSRILLQRDGITPAIWDVTTGHREAEFGSSDERAEKIAVNDQAGLVALLSNKRRLSLWDIASAQLLFRFDQVDAGIAALAFDEAGTQLGTVSKDGNIRLYDTQTGLERVKMSRGRGSGFWQQLQFVGRGARLLSFGWNGALELWNAQTGDRLAFMVGDRRRVEASGKFGIEASEDGRWLFVETRYNDGELWLRRPYQKIATLASGEAGRVVFGPRGRLIHYDSYGFVRLIESADGRVAADLAAPISSGSGYRSNDEISVAFSASGHRALVRDDGKAEIVETATGQTLAVLGETGPPLVGAVILQGGQVATADEEGLIRFWNVETGFEIGSINMKAVAEGQETVPGRAALQQLIVQGLQFTGEGGTLLARVEQRFSTVNSKGKFRVFDLSARRETPAGPVLAVSADGLSALRARDNYGLENLETVAIGPNGIAGRFTVPEEDGSLSLPAMDFGRSVAVSSPGSLFATGAANGAVHLYDASSGRSIAVLEEHKAKVRVMEFGPLGRRLVTSASDGSLVLWDVEKRTAVRRLEENSGHVTIVAFSMDGATVAVANSDASINLWRADGTHLGQLSGSDVVARALLFSPDAKRLLILGDDARAQLWDLEMRQLLFHLKGDDSYLRFSPKSSEGFAFSPNGQWILQAHGGALRLWDLAMGQRGAGLADRLLLNVNLHRFAGLQHDANGPATITFLSEGRVLAPTTDGRAGIWDLATGDHLATLGDESSPMAFVAASVGSAVIVVGQVDGRSQIVDTRSLESRGEIALAKASGQALVGPGDRHLLIWDESSETIELWDLAGVRKVGTLAGHLKGVRWARFSPDGHHVVTFDATDKLRVWSSGNGDIVATLEFDNPWLDQSSLLLASPPEGFRIFSRMLSSLWDGTDGTLIKRYDFSESTAAAEGLVGQPEIAELSPDGRLAVVRSKPYEAVVWETTTGKVLFGIAAGGADILTAAFSPDGSALLSVHRDGTARLWGTRDGTLQGTMIDERAPIRAALFGPHARRVIVLAGGSPNLSGNLWEVPQPSYLALWDRISVRMVARFDEQVRGTGAVDFSADGQWLAALTTKGFVAVWSLADGTPRGRYHEDAGSLALAPSGDWLVVGSKSNGEATVYSLDESDHRTILQGHGGPITQTVISPNERLLATASADGTARLWDLTGGSYLRSLRGQGNQVTALAFSPDSGTLALGGEDGRITLWPTAPAGVKWDGDWQRVLEFGRLLEPLALTPGERVALQLPEENRDEPEAPTSETVDLNIAMACDLLAGDPLDLDRQSPGVPLMDLDVERSITTCRQALDDSPGESRYAYQLARALARADQNEAKTEARALFEQAAGAGYAAAQRVWGDFLAQDDLVSAIPWWRKAAAYGDPDALYRVGVMLQLGLAEPLVEGEE